MLYRLTTAQNVFSNLEPLPFLDFSEVGKLEKDLEVIMAEHLFEVLFEGAALLPIFQERALQAEADIYAINREGDLIIFELKRGFAGADAMLQALRYGQDAGQWTYNKLEEKYKTYRPMKAAALAEVHKEAFNLERALLPSEFNQRQHFMIVGNASNDALVSAVDYWKKQGLSVDFLPYRLYQISGEYYFEFFALPYDRHQNPSAMKGVLFDTNRSWDEDAIWEMVEKSRVAAYGDVKHVIEYLSPQDIVFFCHKGMGIVAAAEVLFGQAKDDGPSERYRDVRFLTAVPNRGQEITKYMPFGEVSQVTGKSFFWARTIKVPYLTKDEAHHLLAELKRVL
ncbi:MAG TPA: hypothetical protein VMC85_16500 [Desulfomonilaceae bacterium]|nr:hypothetical protein [Desulfomonilaceae bacterium]